MTKIKTPKETPEEMSARWAAERDKLERDALRLSKILAALRPATPEESEGSEYPDIVLVGDVDGERWFFDLFSPGGGPSLMTLIKWDKDGNDEFVYLGTSVFEE